MEQAQADNIALKQEVEALQTKVGQVGDGSCVSGPDNQAAVRQTLIVKLPKARPSVLSSGGSGNGFSGPALTPTGTVPLNLLTGHPATPPLSSSGGVPLVGSPHTPSTSGWRMNSASGYASSSLNGRLSTGLKATSSRATGLLSLGGGTG